jgi:hypothetical protein
MKRGLESWQALATGSTFMSATPSDLEAGVGEPTQRRALVDGVLNGDGQQQQAVNVAQIELLTAHLQAVTT